MGSLQRLGELARRIHHEFGFVRLNLLIDDRSSTGIVNLYSSSNLVSRQQATATFLPELRPEPYKSLEHLTTAISSLAFHPSGEMMVAASSAKRNALKMVCSLHPSPP